MHQRSYRKGDLVRFQFATRVVQGVVKEDRGPIGIDGRRLYLVEFTISHYPDTLARIELPAVDLQPVHDSIAAP
jgi:hypothetical protein